MITLALLKAKEKFDGYLAACNVHPRFIKESTQEFWKEMLAQKEELGDGLYELILMACNEVEQTKKDPCTLPKLPLDVLQLLFTKEKAGELVNSFKLETRLFTNTRASGKYKILQALATSPNRLRLLGLARFIRMMCLVLSTTAPPNHIADMAIVMSASGRLKNLENPSF